MLAENHTAQGEELFTYVIASGDMRFVEIGERALFLRHDPDLGQIIRGEVPECGPGCDANLSAVLLEYVMGCEDCREANRTSSAADRFGQRLGRRFMDLRFPEPAGASGIEALTDAVSIVLTSLDVPFGLDQSGIDLRFTLAYCPLHTTAAEAGLNLWAPLAHRALVAMIETFLLDLAPAWTLQSPAERESDAPLKELRFVRV